MISWLNAIVSDLGESFHEDVRVLLLLGFFLLLRHLIPLKVRDLGQ